MSHRKDDTLHLDFLTPNLVLTLLSHLTNDELFIFITAISSTWKTIAPLMVTHINITISKHHYWAGMPITMTEHHYWKILKQSDATSVPNTSAWYSSSYSTSYSTFMTWHWKLFSMQWPSHKPQEMGNSNKQSIKWLYLWFLYLFTILLQSSEASSTEILCGAAAFLTHLHFNSVERTLVFEAKELRGLKDHDSSCVLISWYERWDLWKRDWPKMSQWVSGTVSGRQSLSVLDAWNNI